MSNLVRIDKLIYTDSFGPKTAAPSKSAALFGRAPRTCRLWLQND